MARIGQALDKEWNQVVGTRAAKAARRWGESEPAPAELSSIRDALERRLVLPESSVGWRPFGWRAERRCVRGRAGRVALLLAMGLFALSLGAEASHLLPQPGHLVAVGSRLGLLPLLATTHASAHQVHARHHHQAAPEGGQQEQQSFHRRSSFLSSWPCAL